MGRYRLTTASKIMMIILVLALAGGGIFAGVKTGFIKTSKDQNVSGIEVDKVKDNVTASKPSGEVSVTDIDENGNVINTEKETKETINISLDEWIGWKPILDSNGGLTTQPGSIYDQKGIDVNISIINDATQSSNALISGNLDAAGYTINRTAFLSQKFKNAGKEVVMPYISNFSNGGDGIIAKSSIDEVSELLGATIGVPQFSEAHSLVVWFVNQSDLTQEQKDEIINNLVYFATPEEAAKAFFAGQIDVAATWEPYLTQTQNMSDAHILFSTASSSSLIMDGILFDKEFAEKHSDIIAAFIDGALEAAELYETDLTTIKNVMPMFSTVSDQDIVDNCASAKLTTYADNIDLFKGTAKTIYTDMCDVWTSIGESVDAGLVDTIFDSKYIETLSGEYFDSKVTTNAATATVNADNEEVLKNTSALLHKSATVNFVVNTAAFLDSTEATQALDEFIEIAKVLNGTVIQIEGNTEPINGVDPASDQAAIILSEERAKTVKQYFVLNGIDADRIIVVGNGATKPVVENVGEENRARNRRTDVYFKLVE